MSLMRIHAISGLSAFVFSEALVPLELIFSTNRFMLKKTSFSAAFFILLCHILFATHIVGV